LQKSSELYRKYFNKDREMVKIYEYFPLAFKYSQKCLCYN